MQRLVFALGRQARVCASLGRVYTPRLTQPICLFSTCAGKDSRCGKACGQMCGDCHKKTLCWNCHHFTDCQSRFCPTCHKIQPVYSEEEGGGNFFQLFGLHETYDINPAELEANFKNLQKVVHPDLFSTKSPEEKRVSEKVSTTLNIAHNKLKDPVTRAAYLVKLRTGKDVLGEDKNYKVPVELLMEVMELRERVSEAKSAKEGKAKESVRKEAVAGFKKHENEFRCSLCQNKTEKLCDEAVALKYYDSVLREIDGDVCVCLF